MSIWMALPPEVHSTLLSSGPGPGPLLAAAAGWQALSVEYSTAAADLATVLSSLLAGSWQGVSADRYASAHIPFLAWLSHAGADSAAAAAQHQAAAAAYAGALVAMPTMAELAVNHAVHGALIATNFFGINTVPIAVNEADYGRMWLQAAATMTAYTAQAGAALAAVPSTPPAPVIMSPGAETYAASSASNGPFDGIPFMNEAYRALQDFISNPSPGSLLSLIVNGGLFAAYESINVPVYMALTSPLWGPVLGISLALIGLAPFLESGRPAPAEPGQDQPVPESTRSAPRPQQPLVSAGMPSPSTVSAAPSAQTATVSASAPVGATAPVVPYLVAIRAAEPPDPGLGPTFKDGDQARVPAAAAVAAASATRSAAVQRRRRARATSPAPEFMDMNVTVDPERPDPPGEAGEVEASARGAGQLGSAHTAAGFVDRKTGGSLNDASAAPLLPTSWDPDQGIR